jgi:transposase
LRERAVTSARDAEVLLRWLQRPRVEERVGGVDLDSMSERELERLHSGLVRLASMDETVLAALVEHVLAGDEPASRA